MKRIAILLLAAAAACVGDTSDRRFASLGTAGTGGIYYPLGGTLAAMISEAIPELQVTAEVTGGSVENLNRVASGEMDLGMGIGTTLALGATASDGRYDEVRIVAPLYPNIAHVLAGRGTTAADLREARGLRVSIGAPGSGTEQMAREILAAHGLSVDDIAAQYLSFGESATALRDGAIDLAILSVGYPAAAVLEATTTGAVHLLPIPEPTLAALLEAHPYYRRDTIPAGTYAGVDDDVRTAAVMNWIFARADLDHAVVNAILGALQNRRDELVAINEIARQIDLDALRAAPLPLHDAAAAWLQQPR